MLHCGKNHAVSFPTEVIKSHPEHGIPTTTPRDLFVIIVIKTQPIIISKTHEFGP